MKLIKASYEIIDQKDLFKHIEIAARTCYKSEDKITDDSAIKMIEKLTGTNPPHTAMLEHGTVYLKLSNENDGTITQMMAHKYRKNKYSKTNEIVRASEPWFTEAVYITTNYRVIVENKWLDDLRYACGPTENHEKRITVKFVCDRGVSHEFVRHRVFSFAQESTRYCNYSKDKFGNELTFIEPCWLDMNRINSKDHGEVLEVDLLSGNGIYVKALAETQDAYFRLLENGWKPQQARAVLPNSLKTELVMTGFASDWEHFFMLRDAATAHPQAYELASPLHEEFIKLEYIK